MKYYKIKVKREPNVGGGTRYIYPAGFHDLKYFSINYESIGEPANVEKRKDMGYEYVVVAVSDDEIVNIPDAEEIDEVKTDLNLIEQGEYFGLKINTPGSPVEILFSNEGQLSASIKIGNEEQIILR